ILPSQRSEPLLCDSLSGRAITTVSMINFEPNMDYGLGFDTLRNEVRGLAVTPTEPSSVGRGMARQTQLQLTQITQHNDLINALELSASASLSSMFASGSVRLDFARKTTINQFSLYLLVHCTVRLSHSRLTNPVLTDEAVTMLTTTN